MMTTVIIMISIYGIIYPLHQQMGGVHCQVGEGVVTLGKIIIMIIIITLGNIKKRLLKHITNFPTV